jgi:hypothetical protein
MEKPANASNVKTITTFLKAPFPNGDKPRDYNAAELMVFLKSCSDKEKDEYAAQAASIIGWQTS